MEYTFIDIEKIIEFKSWTDYKKIDELFRIDCYMYTNLGKESTRKEVDDTKRKSKIIYKTISKIDPKIGKGLISTMD
tara:strand:+ start:1831 stop:2061 length:231 start_codon:yes stop_codon:yes gene_type:complete